MYAKVFSHEESRALFEKMRQRCVAARCENASESDKNMHRIIFFGEARLIKAEKVDGIDLFDRRKMWAPGQTFSLRSKHFKEDDIIRPINLEVKTKRELRKDEITCFVYLTKHAKRLK